MGSPGLSRICAKSLRSYFVYKAFVEVGLRKPYDLLFRSQQQSMEALQTIFDSVPAGIFYKDKENRFLR